MARPGRPLRILPTPDHHGYSVKFSPFNPNLLAVATGQNFGLSGSGLLIIIDLSAPGDGCVCGIPWSDGLFDLTWSEQMPTIVVTASGDGSLQMWNTEKTDVPLMVFKEHGKEAYSVDWSLTRDKQMFVSASWDQTIKLWDPNHQNSVLTMVGHDSLIYQAVWSPHLSGCVASVSGDGTLKIWNVAKSPTPTMSFKVVSGEALTCDWSKYNKNVIATSGTDSAVRIWDLRKPGHVVFTMMGHEYPIRRLKFSPFVESQIATVSYDFTTRLWDYKLSGGCIETFNNHSEFVYGVDFSNLVEGLLVDCSWDQTMAVYSLPKPNISDD